MIRRISALLFLAGIAGIVMGVYRFCIELPSSENPSVVTVSELERHTPWNRHVAISNAVISTDDGVHYTETHYAAIMNESYFLPVRDSALAGLTSIPPRVYVKVSKTQMTEIEGKRLVSDPVIDGMRLTRWDIEGKVKDYLVSSLGPQTANNLVIIELGKKPEGIGAPLGTIVAGIGMLAGGLCISGTRGLDTRSR